MSLTLDYISVFILDERYKPFVHIDSLFKLKHNTPYKVCIVNHHEYLNADATVSINGKDVGTFRVNSDNKIVIDRPINVNRKFVFYKAGSIEGEMSASNTPSDTLGVVEVKVRMEDEEKRGWFDKADDGGGLVASSRQRFVVAQSIHLQYRVITIRAKIALAESEEPL